MKWTLALLSALLAAGAAAPSLRPGTNMNHEDTSEPITIPTTTQNIFGDVVSVTPPDAESIELQHLNDDTRFYPDYGDKGPVDDAHFPDSQGPSRAKRQSVDYNDLNDEMYLDSTYPRKRRDTEPPLRIDLAIPGDSDSSSDSSDVRYPASEPDSVSTQITYVIISEDDNSSDEAGQHANDVIPQSTEQRTNDSTSSSDSVERDRVLRAITRTIRARRHSSDGSSTSSAHLLTRKRRQIPYYRLPDFLNYRVGRSVSDDSDDTEPDDAYGLNMKDLSMDGSDLKLRSEVAPLPEFSYEFSELTRPSSTYVDGKLQSYYVPERQKREAETTTEPALDIVTAAYPLGIDATKDNLSLPEGNFLGPRIYAKGDLIQEEQPAVSGIAAPMEKEESIPLKGGSETDTVYSAPVNNLNLPLIIPVVGPTSHPGEEPRIELSVPSGYVPYIIQLSPTNNTNGKVDEATSQTTPSKEQTSTSTSAKPEPPTYLSFVPTIIVTPSTPTPSGNEVSTQTNTVPEQENTGQSSEAALEVGSTISSFEKAQDKLAPTVVKEEGRIPSKQKRADWKAVSSAPAGEIVGPRSQTADWELAPSAPTSGIDISQPTSSWKTVPVGEFEVPKQQTASWEPISNAPMGAVEEQRSKSASGASTGKTQTASWRPAPVGEVELPKQQTASWEPISNAPAGEIEESSASPAASQSQAASSSPSESPAPNSPSSELSSESEMSDQGAPTEWQRARTGQRSKIIPILEKNSVISPNGSFSYSFKSGNGIQVEESGYLKKEAVQNGTTDSGVAQVVLGSYSYPSPDGRIISVKYEADAGGFRPQVQDLPN